MEYNNINFLEEYKRLDNLCRQIYRIDNESGVTSYINDMNTRSLQERTKIPDFNSSLQRLKYLRGLRNKITHELDTLNRNMCTQTDIDWIMDFYDRILHQEDPLAQLHSYNSRKQLVNKETGSSLVEPIFVPPHKPSNVTTRKKSKKPFIFFVFLLSIIILAELSAVGFLWAFLNGK